MLKRIVISFIALFNFLLSQSQPTKVIVRAKAKDAKFIGTGIGGAYVIIRNNTTGELLAKGLTTGTSGNTDVIMKQAVKRNQPLTDSSTAKFEALIDLDEPTFVDIEVLAPVNRRNAAVKASTQAWLIPHKDIKGEGIVLEIPGFIVDVSTPNTHEAIKFDTISNRQLCFRASITMMCGCAITKGGTWNSEDIVVNATIKKEGINTGEVPLHLTERPNLFEGNVTIKEKGSYELVIYAFNLITGNTGVDKVNFIVQ